MVQHMVLLTVLTVCAAAMGAETPATKAASQPAPDDPLQKPLPELKLSGVPVGDVVSFLIDVTGLNITLDKAALKEAKLSDRTPVTLIVKEMTLGQALSSLAKSISKPGQVFEAGLVGRKIVITTASKLEAAQKQFVMDAAKGDDQVLGRKLPELNFNAIGLADVVDFLRDVAGVTIHVDWKALEAGGVKKTTPITVRVRDVSVREALREVVDAASVGKKRRVDFIVNDDNAITIVPAAE